MNLRNNLKKKDVVKYPFPVTDIVFNSHNLYNSNSFYMGDHRITRFTHQAYNVKNMIICIFE